MADQIQFRRGTTAQHSSFIGTAGEVTVDTDKNAVVVHDGSTAGGHEIANTESVSNGNIPYLPSTRKWADSPLSTDGTDVSATGALKPTTGVYLGGTAAANLLDNFKNFTATAPTFTQGFSTVGYTTQLGQYVEIGDLVIFVFDMTTDGTSSVNGSAFRLSAPHTAASSGPDYPGAVGLTTNFNNAGTRLACRISGGNNYVEFFGPGGSAFTAVDSSAFTLRGFVIYRKA